MSKILRIFDHEHGQAFLKADGDVTCDCGVFQRAGYCIHSSTIEQKLDNGEISMNGGSIGTAQNVNLFNMKTDKKIIRQFQFRSSRDPSIVYSTLLYSDGSASCNCPGWARHVAKDGSRSCKHIISAGIGPVSVSEPSGPQPGKKAGGKHGASAMPNMRVTRRFDFEED